MATNGFQDVNLSRYLVLTVNRTVGMNQKKVIKKMQPKYYKIIEANSIRALEKKVNEYIKSGWIPQGGIHYIEATIVWTNDSINDEVKIDRIYTQAIITDYMP